MVLGFCTPGMVPWLPQCIQSSKVDSMCAETSSLVWKHPSFGTLTGFSWVPSIIWRMLLAI